MKFSYRLISLQLFFWLPNNVSNFLQFVLLQRKNTFIRFHEKMKLISWTWCAFPKKSWIKIKITIKLRHGFMDEKAMIATTLISSYHWKTLVHFCLPNSWKRTFKTNSELLLNLTKKQFMLSSFTVNLNSVVCLNIKNWTRSRCHIWSLNHQLNGWVFL